MSRRILSIFIVLSLMSFAAFAKTNNNQSDSSSPNVPIDKGIYVKQQDVQKLYRQMRPAIRQARKSYKFAKKRFESGLPEGSYFFVVTRVRDKSGAEEQMFISVSEILEGTIHGYIYNKPKTVEGFRFRQRYSFPESQIIDWVITKPDGSQEGNYVGKYIDSLR